MKKVLLMLLAAMAVACAPKDGVRTIRTAADQEADLGKIMEIDGPATFRLVVRNTYADTLFPLRMYTPCGCTQVQFSRDPVAPGADQVLEVTYNPAYRPGPLMEAITVYYQASPVQAESFVIKGEVIGYNHPIEEDRPYHFGEGLYMSHKLLLFGVRRPGAAPPAAPSIFAGSVL